MAVTWVRQRKLYYRELVARFAHHPALVWNLGEENTNTNEQRKAFAKYIHELDPYDHPVVCHTYPGKYDEVYRPLLGYGFFEGPSLQTNDTHRQTMKWLDLSAKARRPWFVCLDELGPSHTGVKPDNDDYGHDERPSAASLGQPDGRRRGRRVVFRLQLPP